jgi:hypothetical protein
MIHPPAHGFCERITRGRTMFSPSLALRAGIFFAIHAGMLAGIILLL